MNDDDEPINPNQAFKEHGEKVFETIKKVVNSIDNLKSLESFFNEMGYHHYKNGSRPEHFQVYNFFYLLEK